MITLIIKDLCLLEIFVYFEAVVSRISHKDMAIWSEGHSLRAVEWVSQCVYIGQKRSLGIKYLKSNIYKFKIRSVLIIYVVKIILTATLAFCYIHNSVFQMPQIKLVTNLNP